MADRHIIITDDTLKLLEELDQAGTNTEFIKHTHTRIVERLRVALTIGVHKPPLPPAEWGRQPIKCLQKKCSNCGKSMPVGTTAWVAHRLPPRCLECGIPEGGIDNSE